MDLLMSGISEMVNRSISVAGHEIDLLREYESELEKLRRTLNTIQAYSEDAERRQVGDKVVRQWLKRLKRVAYDAEDILDEDEYETLRREIAIKRNWTDAFEPFAFRRKVAHRIQEVNETLKGLTTEMQAFNLNKGEGSKKASSETTSAAVNRRETFSLIDNSQVFGRENDVKKIKEMLLGNGLNISHQADDGKTFTIIPIIGFGGMGKTTLAQILYNDEEVKKAFEIKKWVSVSNHFGDTTLLKIVAKALCKTYGADLSTKEQMLSSLETELEEVKKENKKFLLILDDVWDEQSANGADTYFRDQWDDLKLALKHCVAGCRIIVTTRSLNVARIMGTTVSPYHHLGVLSENDCWAIFEKWAFRSGGAQRSPALEKIGRDIVKKCGGVPLVAKTLGALLNSKQTPEAWLSIKDSETLINITSGDDSNIVRVLKLSYDHLSPPLRRCFSYCAIFPKGRKIGKKQLIRMWIAQGFLQSSNSNDIENVGNDYFDTLCGSCFFQDIQVNDSSGEIEACKMHDLMHDLAQSTSGKECLVVDSSAGDISETYHLWVDNDDLSKLNWEGKNSERLRTFVGKANVELSKFKCLRALVLRSEPGIETPPDAVGNLVHLRYLHINSRSLQALPTSICQLYKLQILHVKECDQLKELPTDLWKLINLRHLIVGTWTKMPKGFGRLTDLREVSILTAGLWENGCEIEELENLNHLRGRLYICGLENVRTVESAEKARLKEKKNVNILTLVWHGKNDSVNYDEVLEAMQAPPRLSKMCMSGFPGGNLPKWLTNSSMLPYLIKLDLAWCRAITSINVSGCGCLEKLLVYDCKNLKVIISTPLPFLEILDVQYIHGLVIDEAFGNSNLKELTIRDCPCVMSLNIGECKLLQKLKLLNCPGVKITHFNGLTTLPDLFGTLSSLRTLVISHWANLTQFVLTTNTHPFPSLETLNISHCDNLTQFVSTTTIHPFPSLRTLEISHCDNLTQFVSTTTPHPFPSLWTLKISHCDNLTQFVSTTTTHPFPSLHYLRLAYVCGTFVESIIKSLTSLRSLSVEGVPDLTTLPIGFSLNNKELRHIELMSCPGFRDEDGLQLMTSLRELTIEDCQSVTSLGFIRGLVSLRCLTVLNCKGIVISSIEDLESPESLYKLQLGGFSEDLDYFPFPTRPMQCLEVLDIEGWSKLMSLPRQLQHLTKLLWLKISNFDGLIALPDWIGKLSSLEYLDIHCCKNLMHLPSKTDMQRLTSLRHLTITSCPNLTKRCMAGGEERCKIPCELLKRLNLE